ncbi:MAG: hypothetical protein ACYC9M_01710 [Desulfobulbaceae bacterium]
MEWLQFFPDVLKYGATGLSALLFFFAYLLLREQCKKKDSDPKVLREIRIYMFISVFLAVISLVSSLFCSSDRSNSPEEITIDGTVKKEGNVKPSDITIFTGYPPIKIDPTSATECRIVGVKVVPDPQGTLPNLAINAPGYYIYPVELEKKFKDKITNNTIDIGEIVLRREEE